MSSRRPAQAKTWIEVSSAALRHNYAVFAKRVAPAVVFPIVKANAYGHGLREVISVLKTIQPVCVAVDSLTEALFVKEEAPALDVLVLGHIPFADLSEAVKAGIAFVACQEAALKAAVEAATPDYPARVHLELETGLHRQGVSYEDLSRLLSFFRNEPRLLFEGACMHFADVEDTRDTTYADQQIERYEQFLQHIESAGFRPRWRHAACSAAGVLSPRTWFDAIRLGISLYGIWSSELVREAAPSEVQLQPVLTWKTVIAQVKQVSKGESIGYGRTEKTIRETKLAVLPVGYADGFDRVANSSCGEVLIRDQRCRVMGRVCMNMCMVDVTDLGDVSVEDEVVLLGQQGEEFLSAEEHASRMGSISYEVVARLSSLIPRVVY